MRSLAAFLFCTSLGILNSPAAQVQTPADVVDLRFWKLTLPTDQNKDGKVDEIPVRAEKTRASRLLLR